MLQDGILLVDSSVATNFQIQYGTSLPASGNNVGELFFLTSGSIGLYVYDGASYVPSASPATATMYISGDASGSGLVGTSVSLTLATVNGNVGTFGSASNATIFSVNGKGLVTSASQTPIAIAASQVTSGTFADARIASSNVTQFQSSLTILESQITDGSLLARNAGNEVITGSWQFQQAISGQDPSAASHLATKQYVDNVASGLDPKASVRAATTANITLSGAQTIDGVSVVSGDRVLVKDQSAATQNGIYVASATAWARSSDFDGTPASEVTSGSFVFITEGTVNGAKGFVLVTADPITIGTTGLVWTQVSAAPSTIAGTALTGTTLASNIVSSSLTSVGTLGSLAVTNGITAMSFTGAVVGDVTGNVIGALTGNASTATKLAATKNINGVAFDGSADITVTAAAGTLTGTTLASNVVNSSLTSVGTLGSLTVTGAITAGSINATVSGNATTATALATGRTFSVSGDATGTSAAFDGSANASIPVTLATVNATTGQFGTATQVPQFTVNGKGLITAAIGIPISLTSSAVSDFVEAVQDVVGNSSFLSGANGVTTTYTDVSNTLVIGLSAVPNASLANSSVTIGSTNIALGATSTALAGLSTVTSAAFSGPLTGNVTGNLTGNASTATKFASSVTINGVAFDGSGNITVPAAAGTLTGTVLASNVTTSSLTSVGTLTSLTVSGGITGTITTATNIAGGSANAVPVQTGAGTTSVTTGLTFDPTSSINKLTLGAAGSFAQFSGAPNQQVILVSQNAQPIIMSPGGNNTVTFNSNGSIGTNGSSGSSGQVLISTGGTTAATWSSTPTLTGTNFSAIPNSALTNSSILIGSTSISLGGASPTLSGLSAVTATTFTGSLIGNVTGNVTGNVSGNAGTATALATPRTINGVSFDGTSNITIATASGTLTGTTLPSNIVNSSLQTLGVQAANLNMGGFVVTNAAAPTAGTDLTTKNYVDAAIAGLSWKTSVKAATTANITLSAPQTIDGISLIAGDRVLVKNQTTTSQNGVYVVAAGAWTRASDADSAVEVDGSAVYVLQGSTLADTGWTETASVTTLGTDAVVYAQFAGSGTYTAGTGISLTGNTFTNTGVTSLTGTTNQIAVSGSAGAVTLSLPTDVIITGAFQGTSFITSGTTTAAGLWANGTVTAVSSNARGVLSRGTLVAAANSDVLSGFEVSSAVASVGALTGITYNGLNIQGQTVTKSGAGTIANAYGINVNAPTIGTANWAARLNGAVDIIGAMTISGGITGSITGAASLNVLKSGDTMTGALTNASGFIGPVTGNVTGNLTGSVTGAASLNVLKAGDTMTGNLVLSNTTGIAMVLNANAGSGRGVQINTAGVARWYMGSNTLAESGSNVGSNFILSRYDDAGSLIDTPLTISRSTGSASFTAPMTNAVSTAGNIAMLGLTNTNAAGGTTVTFGANNGAVTGYVGALTANALNLVATSSTPLNLGTNNLVRLAISAAGNVGIGSSSSTAASLVLNASMTGGTSYHGLLAQGQVQSDVTGTATFFGTNISTQATGFAITTLNHFRALQSTIGVGSTISQQIGYNVDPTMVGGLNNYGYFGNLSHATASVSNVSLTSNVVTITTAAAHAYTAGMQVSVAATTNTSVNGTFTITSVTSTTFSYAKTGTNIASVADTGSVTSVGRWNLYMTGTAPNYISGSLGIGTNTPTAALDVAGTMNVSGTASFTGSIVTGNSAIATTTTSVTTTSATTIDSFSTASFRTAKYIVQVFDSTNSQYHAIEILVIHDNTTVYKTEYAEIFTGSALGTFDASIATGTLSLQFTATAATTKTVKVNRTAIGV